MQQHLNFTARIYQVANYEALAAPLLEEMEIADRKNALPGELSRGMKQKLAIACGLLHSPRVIYFDEPLTGLDPLGIRRMKDSILKRARDGAAIIISSHLLHLVEEICSHILILKNGKKIADGHMMEIRRKFSEQSGEANLEEIFFRATSEKRNRGPAGRVAARATAVTGTALTPRAATNMISALFYLQFHSVKNRLKSRIKRLQAAEIPRGRNCRRPLVLLLFLPLPVPRTHPAFRVGDRLSGKPGAV